MYEIEGYKTEKLTIDLVWANIFGIIILIPILIVYGLPYYLIWNPVIDIKGFMDSLSFQMVSYKFAIVVCSLLSGIVLHELIHGITWAIFAKQGFKSIRFGILWTMLTPYCHCKEPLSVRQYIIGALTPAVFLGVAPAIFGIWTQDLGMLAFGTFFTMAAAGDFLVVNLLRNEKSTDLVQDHPSEAGCFVYRKID